jgi:hypothetical protein
MVIFHRHKKKPYLTPPDPQSIHPSPTHPYYRQTTTRRKRHKILKQQKKKTSKKAKNRSNKPRGLGLIPTITVFLKLVTPRKIVDIS